MSSFSEISNGSSIKTTSKLIILDTTLRDGEQSAGVDLSVDEKIEIARELSRLGVDIVEAGFPASCHANFEAVQAISREAASYALERKDYTPPIICALARCNSDDIRQCYEALKDAPRKRIHLTIGTSDIHLQYKLKMSRQECLEKVISSVKLAKSLCDDIQFGAEDSARSSLDFLCSVFAAAIEHGATTLNFTDTVGKELSEIFGAKLRQTISGTSGASKEIVWSVHCHNDLGLATANTLAGIQAGALQAEVTINGIGERAGNAALEEVVMGIKVHPDSFPVHVNSINTQRLTAISRFVSRMTGFPVQPNKAIVGANAFAHESGIHQDGILKNRMTYEIISPSVVGLSSCKLPIGKLSGRAGFKNHLISELGLDLNEQQIEQAFIRFKNLNA